MNFYITTLFSTLNIQAFIKYTRALSIHIHYDIILVITLHIILFTLCIKHFMREN